MRTRFVKCTTVCRVGSVGALLVAVASCVGLELTPIKTASHRPSNVAVYFRIENEAGDPVSGLNAGQFRIYEDSQLVSLFESKQTIVSPEIAAVHYTMLLVDMSGSVSHGGGSDAVIQAVGAFADRVEKQQHVGIFAFDGSPELYPIAPFTDQPGSARAGVQALASFRPRDPSTNLNGAIVKAFEALDAALARAPQPLKFGTLVVFTDGSDRAKRVSGDEMYTRVHDKPFDVFAIGLGSEVKEDQLRQIGKNATAMAADRSKVFKAFDDIGVRIEARTKSYYLLSYCSPSRAGKHEVRIEATVKDSKTGNEESGSLSAEFDATGFGPGCDPKTPPSFDVTKGDALAPKPEAEKPPESKKKEEEKKSEEPKEEKKESRVPERPPPPPRRNPVPRPPPPPPPPPPENTAPASPQQDFNP
jgi:hypothetical protein